MPVERQLESSDPEVVVTERFPMVSGLSDPVMVGTVNELLRYVYDQFYIVEEEERAKRSLWVDYTVSLENERFLSLKITASEYLKEAAHPLNYLEAITFDLEQGYVLALPDLFLIGSNYRQRINAFIRQQLSRRDASGEPLIPLISPFRGIEIQNPFYLTSVGVVVFFSEYQYTPHSWGPLEVEIPYVLLRDIMIERYKSLGEALGP
jgi:hypothetical protein